MLIRAGERAGRAWEARAGAYGKPPSVPGGRPENRTGWPSTLHVSPPLLLLRRTVRLLATKTPGVVALGRMGPRLHSACPDGSIAALAVPPFAPPFILMAGGGNGHG